MLGAALRAPQRIAFASNRDGNRELYVMDADGRGVRRLTGSASLNPVRAS
jgi:Tol biopolymer transport system component